MTTSKDPTFRSLFEALCAHERAHWAAQAAEHEQRHSDPYSDQYQERAIDFGKTVEVCNEQVFSK